MVIETLKTLLNRFQGNTLTIRKGVGAGLKFDAPNADPGFRLGTYELPVQKALAQYLQPGAVFYDIGANVGFFSIIAAKKIGNKGQVYAFEPVPENVTTIQRNVELNRFTNVTVVDKAVSSSSGQAELLLAHHIGGAVLATAAMPPDMKGTMFVETVTIDNSLDSIHLKPPTVVKIDVEGAEIDVLRGMMQTIQKFKPVIFYEVDDSDRSIFERKSQELAQFMASLDYRIIDLENSYLGREWYVGHKIAVPSMPNS
jgi:FkbM family methyltransferase